MSWQIDLTEATDDDPTPLTPAGRMGKSGKGGPPMSQQLALLALNRFDLVLDLNGDVFVTPRGSHLCAPLHGRGSFGQQLAAVFHDIYGRPPSRSATTDAVDVLAGYARRQDRRQVALRCGLAAGVVWLDLGDAAGTVVELQPGRWRLTQTGCPVYFRRTALTAAMPWPLTHDSRPVPLNQWQTAGPAGWARLGWLRDHLNINPDDWAVLVAWLVDVLASPETPKPVLAVTGEQGTAKTTATKRLVALVDPSPVPVRPAPNDQDKWLTAIAGSVVVGLDNLSHIPPSASDDYCRAASGDGLVKRKLYADDDLIVREFRRSIILNGITFGALRGDLAERTVRLELEPIPEDRRRRDAELAEAWELDHPSILAGLLDLTAAVLATPQPDLDRLPRMADFATIAAKVDALTGLDAFTRITQQQTALAEDALTANPWISAVVKLGDPLSGTSGQLLDRGPKPQNPGARGWPDNPRQLTALLDRNAAAMRKAGWHVDKMHNRDKTIVWALQPPPAALID